MFSDILAATVLDISIVTKEFQNISENVKTKQKSKKAHNKAEGGKRTTIHKLMAIEI